MISTSYLQWMVYPVPFYLILPLNFFSKLMPTCISNSYGRFHLRFHLPWLTCSPWGLILNVNQLAQIISWTHQSNPMELFLPSCLLPLQCITLLLYWVTATKHRPCAAHELCFIHLGKEWSRLEQGRKREEKESRPHSFKTKSFNVLFPWEKMEKGGCGRQHISAVSCRHSRKWHGHGVSWVPPFLPLTDWYAANCIWMNNSNKVVTFNANW